MIKAISNISRRNFLLLSVAAVVILYSAFYTQRTMAPDETGNLLLGKHILQFDYPEDFFHRMPLVPLLASSFFALGFGAAGVLFAIPLIFICLSVPVTYVFAKDIADEKTARLSVISLLVFFVFWRWGIYVLTDVPLMVFMTLCLHFFFRGLKEARNFYVSGVFLGLSSITKLSFVILPMLIIAYIAATKKTRLLRMREPWLGALIAVLIFSSFFAATYAMKQSVSADMLGRIDERVSGEQSMVIVQVLTGAEYTSATQFLQLALFPLLAFAPFAIFRKLRMKKLMLAYVGLFFILFTTVWVVRLRYFSPVFPVVMILVAEGYFFIRERYKRRQLAIDASFIILAAVSLINTFYMISLDSGSLWGAEELATYTSGLDGFVASDYLPHYLNLTGDVLMNTTVTKSLFYGNFSDGLVKENKIKYIVLSLYDEWNRRPDTSARFHPHFGPLEITFVSRPYSNGRIPPDYTFTSDLYLRLESDPDYVRVHEIRRGDQVVFIIYEAAY